MGKDDYLKEDPDWYCKSHYIPEKSVARLRLLRLYELRPPLYVL